MMWFGTFIVMVLLLSSLECIRTGINRGEK